MTEEPPKPDRRPRPDRTFRARALGLTAAPTDDRDAVTGGESLWSLLAGMADRERNPSAEPDSGVWSATGETYEPVATPEPRPPTRSSAAPPPGPDEADRSVVPVGPMAPARLSVPWWRRVALASLVLVLIGAIPVLAGAGYRLVTRSTDGNFSQLGATPSDPGYEELVTSTPTALVVHTDADGLLVGVTFLALGAEGGGGVVIFMPIDTLTPLEGFGVDRLSGVYTLDNIDVEAKLQLVADSAANILNVGMDEIIALDDQGWRNAVDPVAPFPLRNLDSLSIAGAELPAGRIDIAADQVGPYLSTLREGESEASRLARHEQFWRGWLEAVGESNLDDAVPGEEGSGLGLFIRTLARGEVRFEILPGAQEGGEAGGYSPDESAVRELVADTVPVPDAARPGSRRTVRLLNGVSADRIPLEVTRQVTALDGAVTVVGNGPAFDNETTSIVYADASNADYAEVLKGALGGTATVERIPEAPDNIDVTIVLGRDILGDTAPASTTSVPSGTNSTVPGEN